MREVNIDAALVAGHGRLDRTEERLVELTNGCICCTLREDLLDTVGELARSGHFDTVLIEFSGISEPMPVAATVLEIGSAIAGCPSEPGAMGSTAARRPGTAPTRTRRPASPPSEPPRRVRRL